MRFRTVLRTASTPTKRQCGQLPSLALFSVIKTGKHVVAEWLGVQHSVVVLKDLRIFF